MGGGGSPLGVGLVFESGVLFAGVLGEGLESLSSAGGFLEAFCFVAGAADGLEVVGVVASAFCLWGFVVDFFCCVFAVWSCDLALVVVAVEYAAFLCWV